MNIKKVNIKNDKQIYLENYNTIDEFVNTVEMRSKIYNVREYDNINRCTYWKPTFHGVRSYKEAKNLFINGFNEPIKDINNNMSKYINKEQIRATRRVYSSVAGYMPIVPNALLGLPNSMLNQQTIRKKNKIINIVVNCGLSGNVHVNQVIRYYTQMLSDIVNLERAGYRCRVSIFDVFCSPTNKTQMIYPGFLIKLKDESQPLNIKKLAFELCHPAMERVYGFGWFNSLPLDKNKYYDNSLGWPLYTFDQNYPQLKQDIVNSCFINDAKNVYIEYQNQQYTNINPKA